MSKTVKEIEEILKNHWVEGGEGWDTWEWQGKPVDVPDLGVVTVEHTHGGEGQGDQYYLVLKIQMKDATDGFLRYFRQDGWYASHDGGYYDGPFYEVTPKEKVVTVYEKAD